MGESNAAIDLKPKKIKYIIQQQSLKNAQQPQTRMQLEIPENQSPSPVMSWKSMCYNKLNRRVCLSTDFN